MVLFPCFLPHCIYMLLCLALVRIRQHNPLENILPLCFDDKTNAAQEDQPLRLTGITEEKKFARAGPTGKIDYANQDGRNVDRLGILWVQFELGEDGSDGGDTKGEMLVRLLDELVPQFRLFMTPMESRQSQDEM